MRVTVAQLEALVWVARLGSVSAAATQLNVTQSTVSLRLRDLNEAIGKPMFRKSGRQLVLTADGVGVLSHASVIMGEVEKLHGLAKQETIAGLVRMGVSEALALAGLPSIINRLKLRYPGLRTEMTIATSADLERGLLEGRLDMALGINLRDDPRLKSMDLGVQQATWLASSAMNLPERIRPRDIGHLPVLSNPSPSPMYQQTVNWFRSEGLAPQQISVSNSITIIARLVAAGIGVAILPTRLVQDEIAAGTMVALKCDPKIDDARMIAAYRTDDWRATISATLEVTREVIDELRWLEG